MITPHDPEPNRISITACGPGHAQLAIDGHPLRCCTRALLTLDAGHVPTLELSLSVLADLATDLPAYVVLDADAQAALLAMGWAAPPARPGGAVQDLRS
jgi:hypothetical protein